MVIDPISLLSAFGGLAGGGDTKVVTNNKTNVATQVSLGVANSIGGSPSAQGGAQSAPSTQTSNEGGGYIPVFGANPSDDPTGQLNSLLGGSSGVASAPKGLIIAGVAAVAIFAVIAGLRGK